MSQRVCILGGTVFLGRAIAVALASAGHHVTVFHRGNHPLAAPEGVYISECLGNRDPNIAPGLESLGNGTWDMVIDTSGYVPRLVRASAEALRGRVGCYAFISSISAYRDFTTLGIDEDYPLAEPLTEPTEVVTGETYGPLKVMCEQVVQDIYGESACIIRPGLIAGPYDPTDRLSSWIKRILSPGDMLCPVSPAFPIQYIDVADIAQWFCHILEHPVRGVYQAVGHTQTFGDLLQACRALPNAQAGEAVWVDAEFLAEQAVSPWMGPESLGLWLPDSPDSAGMPHCSPHRALQAGLQLRPVADTVAAIAQWLPSRPDRAWGAGLSAGREAELLALWRERG
jgi:2'-hydroxyisoflavone reductase